MTFMPILMVGTPDSRHAPVGSDLIESDSSCHGRYDRDQRVYFGSAKGH